MKEGRGEIIQILNLHLPIRVQIFTEIILKRHFRKDTFKRNMKI